MYGFCHLDPMMLGRLKQSPQLTLRTDGEWARMRVCAWQKGLDRQPDDNESGGGLRTRTATGMAIIFPHTHARARACTHAHTHTHARARARAHTHTHTSAMVGTRRGPGQ